MVHALKVLTDRLQWLSILIVLCAAPFLFEDQTSRLLGRWFPVLEPTFEITARRTVESPSGPQVILAGRAFKKCGDCSYIRDSLRWYLGAPGEIHTGVTAKFTDPPELRGEGWTEWTGVVVGVFENQLPNSYATVQHWRPGIPIPITSTFYIPGGQADAPDR